MINLSVGDIHIKVNNIIEIDEMTKKLIELANKIKPNFIVLLGDILDRHSNIHVLCLMKAENLIYSLSQIAPTFVLIGNHDRPNNSNYLTDEHPFNSLKFWKNVYIVDKPINVIISLNEEKNLFERVCVTSRKNVEDGEYRFIFAPYVSPGRFNEALQTLVHSSDQTLEDFSFDNCSAVFAHQEIKNCKLGAIISTLGDEWPLENPLLISGHIHDYDMLQPNMIYTGVPLQHAFNENSNKTVSLFTFSTISKKEHWEQERIDLGLIKKVTIYLTPQDIPSYEPPKNKLVKLVIKGDESEIKTVAKLDKITQLKKKGVKVVFKTTQSHSKTDFSKTSKMTYRERLLSEMDSEQLIWYNKIF